MHHHIGKSPLGSPRMGSPRTGDPSIRNGMPSRDLGAQGWHKPWSDDAGGACIEVKKLLDGRIALRQSTDPDGPALVFTPTR